MKRFRADLKDSGNTFVNTGIRVECSHELQVGVDLFYSMGMGVYLYV